MPLWPLPGGAVDDPASDENFRSLAESGGKLAEETLSLEKATLPSIWGEVGEEGAVIRGSGFTAKKTAKGKYEVSLTTELSATGIMVPAPKNGGAVFAPAQGAKVFVVNTMNPAETEFQDRAFTFAIQPAR